MTENSDAPLPRSVSVAGLVFGAMLAGAGIAIGVPWAVLSYGDRLEIGTAAATWLTLAGIVGGTAVALLAVYRSLPPRPLVQT